ncbi:MAG: hypothetical protein ACYCOR_03020 [Acidobacteriaceae bacterium]
MRLLLSTILLMFGVGACTASAQAAAAVPHGACQVRSIAFDGWKGQEVTNDWVRLIFVPSLGGRLMQVSFNGHPYLFINPKTKGEYIPPKEAAGRWINYGGDKVWPMPEGNQDEQHWVLQSGPLDDGPYVFKVLSRSPSCIVQLAGPPDSSTGLQYTREITIGRDSPEISFHAVMKNFTGHPIRWSIQSVSQYNLATADDPTQYNRKFWAFAPVNADSAYPGGYRVVDGLANDPSFNVKDGMFSLNWKYLQNEVWLDSRDGWIAVVDGTSGYAMVEKFSCTMNATYPGSATVIFYKTGPAVGLDTKGYPELRSTDPRQDPYYMEAEINSPLVALQPGSTYAMDTEWFPARMDENLRTVTYAGAIAQPFAISTTPGGTYATGSIGVFFPGTLQANLFDEQGIEKGRILLQNVDPREKIELNKRVVISPDIVRVSLHLIGANGLDYGSLGEAFTQQPTKAQ